MKHLKKATILITTILFLLHVSFLTEKAGASSPTEVILDGRILDFDQPPILKAGRVLVPMRAVFENLGAKVQWEAKTQTITAKKDSLSLVLQINQNQGLLNGKTVSLYAPAQIVHSRTLVPLRFISEALGVVVEWNDKEKIVDMKSQNLAESLSSVNKLPYDEEIRALLPQDDPVPETVEVDGSSQEPVGTLF